MKRSQRQKRRYGWGRWPALLAWPLWLGCVACWLCVLAAGPLAGHAQEPATPQASTAEESADGDLEAPAQVGVTPMAADDEIEMRLVRILEATEWFQNVEIRVDQGVVFINGSTRSEDHKTWAGTLARNTQDVVAVVNRLRVDQRPIWDLTPAWLEIRELGRETVQALPLLGLGLLLLIIVWFLSVASVSWARHLFTPRIKNRLLVNVISRAVAIPVFLLGLYLALRVSGLTQIAATVIGGTGLFGLVLGIAFRDIAENFLASILISVQRPFALGDMIEVDGQLGAVQSVTSRGTTLMTLEGNHVQIPNSVIYKSVIRNFTANPRTRWDFVVGIDYGDEISEAQEVLLQVLEQHPAVLSDPAPMILVEELGTSTVKLRIYFWVDGRQHSGLKTKSSVIRQAKVAIEQAGLTMPDEAREIIFPRSVPVQMIDPSRSDESTAREPTSAPAGKSPRAGSGDSSAVANEAENGLISEQEMLKEQASRCPSPDRGENLLDD